MRARHLFPILLSIGCSAPIVGSDAPLALDVAEADTSHVAIDAPVTDAPATDAPPLPCPMRDWGEPVRVAELNGPSHSADARLTDDELYAIVNQALVPVELRRDDTSEPFEITRELMEVLPAGATQLFAPTLSRDGTTMYLSANAGTGSLDLYVTTRADVDATFATPVLAGIGSATEDEFGGFPAPDGIYYWAGIGTLPTDLWFAPLSEGTLGTPARIDELNLTASIEESPVVSADGLTIWFDSDRTDVGWEGFTDVYVASRDALGEDFSAPRRVAALSGPSYDRPTWISADECRIYLDRHTPAGLYEVYVAERLP